jgi:hypothetical protein
MRGDTACVDKVNQVLRQSPYGGSYWYFCTFSVCFAFYDRLVEWGIELVLIGFVPFYRQAVRTELNARWQCGKLVDHSTYDHGFSLGVVGGGHTL